MKKVAMYSGVAVAVIAAVYFVQTNSNANSGAESVEQSVEKTATPESIEPANIAADDKRLQALVQRTPNKVNSPKDKKTEVADEQEELADGPSPFSYSEEAEKELTRLGKVREDLEGEAFIEVDHDEIIALNVGDTLKIEIPELDMFYDVKVDYVSNDAFGNKTVEAELPNYDARYSSVITVGKDAIYANISTPQGLYVMEGNGRYAWVAETQDLIKDVIPDKIGGEFDEDHDHTVHKPVNVSGDRNK